MNIVPVFGFSMHSVTGSVLLLFSLHFLPSASHFPHIDFDQLMGKELLDIRYGSEML